MAGHGSPPGAASRGSVIGARSSIGEGCELTDLTVVGFDQDVAAGTVASGANFPAPRPGDDRTALPAAERSNVL